MPTRDVVLLCGPTACGKSAVAMELSRHLNGEIVSVDSMQVYRGMDIGTAKPTPAERRQVKHHLIDILDPTETFDAAAFLKLANLAVADIRRRNKTAILCGGTGLYFKAFLHGITENPSRDPALRAQLMAIPHSELLRELEKADPATFERIDRNNPRRVIRAVEVIRLTGRPFSERLLEWSRPRSDFPFRLFGISREPGDLRRRIEGRVDQMFATGLVEETNGLLRRGLGSNVVAMQALGYRQVGDHLSGLLTLEETVSLVKIRTCQFARRQRTWFRTQLRPEWVHTEPDTPAPETAEAIRKLLG